MENTDQRTGTTTPTPTDSGRKLLDRVRDATRVLHYSIRTEDAYVGWCRRFILFHAKRHPLEMGEAEVEAFLTHLAVDGTVAASTQNQALSGPFCVATSQSASTGITALAFAGIQCSWGCVPRGAAWHGMVASPVRMTVLSAER